MTITDEKVSYQDGRTCFKLKIKQFRDKMKKWKPGRVIESKHFYYMDSKFYLQVHPNGDSHKERGYVSIHLINDNPYSINVEWEIKLDTRSERSVDCFSPRGDGGYGDSWGWLKFYDQENCSEYLRILKYENDVDDQLEICCTIFKVWQDVHQAKSPHLMTKEIAEDVEFMSGRISNVEEDIVDVREDIRDIKRDLSFLTISTHTQLNEMKTTMENQMRELKDMMMNLCMTVQQNHPIEFQFLAERAGPKDIVDIGEDDSD